MNTSAPSSSGPLLQVSLTKKPQYEMLLLRVAACSLLLGQAIIFVLGHSDWVEVWEWPMGVGYFWAGYWAVLALAIIIRPDLISRYPGTVGMATGALLLLTIANWHAHEWALSQLIEMTLRWSTPLLWLGLAIWPFERWKKATTLAIALTFTGHGLYALGWPYPTPSGFFVMTQNILGISALEAQWFLRVAGGLDLIVLVSLFIPPLARPALFYACFWGLVTATARSMAFVEMDASWTENMRWLAETIVRLTHGLTPLALWFALRSNPDQSESQLQG